MKKHLLLLIGLWASCQTVWAQAPKLERAPGRTTICFATTQNTLTRIAPPEAFLRAQAGKARPSGTAAAITVTYHDFTPEAQKAFQFAVDIWESQLDSPVPIHIDATWKELAAGTLGSAGSTAYYRNFSGAPRTNAWFPVALAEKINGKELNDASEADIAASFNSKFDWYYGLDGKTPADQYDLVTVVLHELGHGLGFVDTMDKDAQKKGSYGLGTLPSVYDTFVENASGQRLTNETIFTNPSTQLGTQLTSMALYFNSPLAVAANKNVRPRLYAPATFSGGSSISHLDEDTYMSGTPNSLMSPQIADGESNHQPGPIMLAMFYDMGWFNTAIRHTPLPDAETLQSYTVKAVVESDGTVTPGSVQLVYAVDGGADVTLTMQPTGKTNEYAATIPNPGQRAKVSYYLKASDNETKRTYTTPGAGTPGKPAQPRYEFNIGPDAEAPVIVHQAPPFLFLSQLPYQLEADVTDNIGVARVYAEVKVNGQARPDVELTRQADGLYKGNLTTAGGPINAGDVISYRIVAQDASTAHNLAYSPASGYYTVPVVDFKPAQATYVNDFNTSTSDFVGNGFSIEKPAGFSNGAIHSLHPYPDGTGPNQESNFIYQLLVPITVSQDANASVIFDEIVLVEPGEEGKPFGTVEFYDYVVVEGSTNDGQTWIPLADGYDARDDARWLAEWNKGTSGNNSTGVGTPALFKERKLNLRDKFSAGDVVKLRFRLFADAGAHGWGWAVDNLYIQTPRPAPTADASGLSVFPNPSSGQFTVSTQLDKSVTSASIVVYNQLGKVVFHKTAAALQGFLNEPINVSSLAAGIYYVTVGEGSRRQTQKLMIHQ
ncbi:T9SS type A sorting domain-containing protein [Hymenobacter sp. BT730]|uniref:T9SS type A sorting domain-containing protein n=1 Tax=Hymenobacter sp. BT730 TaxID=3063332 RepID=UPI0026DF51F3|nr:T9SS type A sorting domain-containing protein [Hymenobacter sp. BT730]